MSIALRGSFDATFTRVTSHYSSFASPFGRSRKADCNRSCKSHRRSLVKTKKRRREPVDALRVPSDTSAVRFCAATRKRARITCSGRARRRPLFLNSNARSSSRSEFPTSGSISIRHRQGRRGKPQFDFPKELEPSSSSKAPSEL